MQTLYVEGNSRMHRLSPDPALHTEAVDLATILVGRWPTRDHSQLLDWVRSLAR